MNIVTLHSSILYLRKTHTDSEEFEDKQSVIVDKIIFTATPTGINKMCS